MSLATYAIASCLRVPEIAPAIAGISIKTSERLARRMSFSKVCIHFSILSTIYIVSSKSIGLAGFIVYAPDYTNMIPGFSLTSEPAKQRNSPIHLPTQQQQQKTHIHKKKKARR